MIVGLTLAPFAVAVTVAPSVEEVPDAAVLVVHVHVIAVGIVAPGPMVWSSAGTVGLTQLNPRVGLTVGTTAFAPREALTVPGFLRTSVSVSPALTGVPVTLN